MSKRVGSAMNCTACRTPTRPSRTTAADWPGTRERYGNRCARCHRYATPEDQLPRPSIEQIQSDLAAYIARRHERSMKQVRA